MFPFEEDEAFRKIPVIPISKNTATHQFSESVACCLLPVPFSHRSVAILNEIGITIFYPAKNNGGKDSAPYSFPESLEVLSKMTFGLVSKNVAKVKTNCYEVEFRQKLNTQKERV